MSKQQVLEILTERIGVFERMLSDKNPAWLESDVRTRIHECKAILDVVEEKL